MTAERVLWAGLVCMLMIVLAMYECIVLPEWQSVAMSLQNDLARCERIRVTQQAAINNVIRQEMMRRERLRRGILPGLSGTDTLEGCK